MNAQNHSGNSALHFCVMHKHTELAGYLQSKGADDSLLNAQGLTCYEGELTGQFLLLLLLWCCSTACSNSNSSSTTVKCVGSSSGVHC
jgi:ankyrin repeat protein